MENSNNSAVPKGDLIDEQRTDVTLEEQAALEAELVQVEEDIQTLKTTLAAKIQRSNELKKRLGYTALSTIHNNLIEGIHKLEDSDAYIKTSEFFGKAKEKSVTVAQEAKEKVESTFTAIKNSETVKTINDKMGSAYSTVKDAIIHATYGHPPDD
ncbi:Tumor protein D52 [Fasciola hepatica]|uniref:Tumor protein D52 n=1 Tax=Fasciola hepatica TaxID=6192 RepID=A0A4E0R5D8_FASHE|nr:Tumor protein D52 [Fasciola hepatica]